jgi:ketosteroid isomerase-like protein
MLAGSSIATLVTAQSRNRCGLIGCPNPSLVRAGHRRVAVVDCFTVDAILKSPVIDISGRAEIRAFAGRFAAQRAAGTQFRHIVSNIAVTVTGNRAAASAYLLVLISKDGNHRSLPPGRYSCELIKEDSGQWRFSRRTVFHDHDYTLDGIGR